VGRITLSEIKLQLEPAYKNVVLPSDFVQIVKALTRKIVAVRQYILQEFSLFLSEDT
jgi:hypothetical protein